MQWYAGIPKNNGLEIEDEEGCKGEVPVAVFRCSRCGFLEFYANERYALESEAEESEAEEDETAKAAKTQAEAERLERERKGTEEWLQANPVKIFFVRLAFWPVVGMSIGFLVKALAGVPEDAPLMGLSMGLGVGIYRVYVFYRAGGDKNSIRSTGETLE